MKRMFIASILAFIGCFAALLGLLALSSKGISTNLLDEESQFTLYTGALALIGVVFFIATVMYHISAIAIFWRGWRASTAYAYKPTEKKERVSKGALLPRMLWGGLLVECVIAGIFGFLLLQNIS